MKKKIPKFSSEDKEREFWAKEDSIEYIDWSQARKVVLPNLKPSVKTISLRLPAHLLADLKLLANKRDVPYQSLLKMFLADRVKQELASSSQKKSKSSPTLQRAVRSASRR